jgi:heme exporter protein C
MAAAYASCMQQSTRYIARMIHALAKPAIAEKLSRILLPLSAVGSMLLLAWGLHLALVASPADYQQGETVRIMYVHVPSAYLAMAGYGVMAVCSLFYLVWRHPMADMIARSAAPVGCVFALVTLITGSIWGKPMWGAWWVWDARLTSFLLLFILYLGYMALEGAFEHPARERQAAAVLALIGAVNLPIIKFSVDWWSTLHQPASLIRSGGTSIHPSMLTPLLVMLAAFSLFFLWMVLLRLGNLRLQKRLSRNR